MWHDCIWYSFIFHNNQFTRRVNQPSHFLTRVSLRELFAPSLSQGGCTIHKTLGSFYLFNYWTHSLRKKRATGPWGMRGAVSSFVGDNKRQSVNRADGGGGREPKLERRESSLVFLSADFVTNLISCAILLSLFFTPLWNQCNVVHRAWNIKKTKWILI